MEGVGVGIGNMYHLLTDVNAVVTIYLADMVERYDVAAVYTQETAHRQHILHALHGQMGDERPSLAFEIEHDVVFHSTDIKDAVERQLAQFAVYTDETGR